MPAIALPIFLAAMQAVRAGTGDCVVNFVGDSTTFGQGAVVAPYAARQSFSAQVVRMLNLYGGIVANHGLAIPAAIGGVGDTRFAGSGWSTGTTANKAMGFGTYAPFYTVGTNPGTFTATVVADVYDVYYDANGGSDFTIQATGGALVTADAQGAVGIRKVTVTAGSASAANVVTFTPLGTAGVYIVGVQARSSTQKRVLVGNTGVPGTSAVQWAGNDLNGTITLNGASHLAAHAPHLTIVALGINDAIQAQTNANFGAAIQALITKAKLSGDVVLLSYNPSSPAATLAREAGYIAVLQNLATTNGIPFWDVFTDLYGGTYDATLVNPANDQYHLSAYGYDRHAQYVFEKLRPYLDWLYPAAGKVLVGTDRGNQSNGTLTLPAVDKVLAPTQYGTGGTEFTGTATGGGGGYPLLSPNVVLFGVDRGDGQLGTVALPVASNVLDNQFFGVNAATQGQYKPADPSWILFGAPAFGVNGNGNPTATVPPVAAVLQGYSYKKGGVTYDGTALQNITVGGGGSNSRIGLGI